MRNSTVDTDVLIVGAGPVGLFLANECARRGLRWRLIEAHARQSIHSKALAIFPRTLEIFDMPSSMSLPIVAISVSVGGRFVGSCVKMLMKRMSILLGLTFACNILSNGRAANRHDVQSFSARE